MSKHTFYDDPEAIKMAAGNVRERLDQVVGSADTLNRARVFQHYLFLAYGLKTKIVDTAQPKDR